MNKNVSIELLWLGQGGFLITFDNTKVVVDPYLSDSLAKRGIPRMIDIPIQIENLKPDYVLITHDHADHFDEETLLLLIKHYPDCRFIGPSSVANHYTRLGLNSTKFHLLDKHEHYCTVAFNVTSVPAYHTDVHSVGYVFHYQNRDIYLSGDTLLDPQLIPDLRKVIKNELSLMMICINGKLGNMDAIEAVEVAKALRPKNTIPMHYGMFESNTVDPTFFYESINQSGLHCQVMVPGITKVFNL